MAYSAITAGEVDTDSPITTSLMTKIKDNDISFNDGTGIADDKILERHIAAASIKQGQLSRTKQDIDVSNQITNFNVTYTLLTAPTYFLGYNYSGASTGAGVSNEASLRASVGTIYNFHSATSVTGHPKSGNSTINTANFASLEMYFEVVRYSEGTATVTANIDSYYITASPPYNLGDGEIPLFCFLKLDKDKKIVQVSADMSPPWVYNGPTRAVKDIIIDGKQYTNIKKIDEETGAVINEQVELTHDIKNADMKIIPHPFILNKDEQVLLLDPVETLEIMEIRDAGLRPSELLFNDYLRLDNTPITRHAPPGVLPAKFKWKDTKRRAGELVLDKRLKQGPFA